MGNEDTIDKEGHTVEIGLMPSDHLAYNTICRECRKSWISPNPTLLEGR